ncbi:MAG TPA: 23S rRNA (pseudouridine(1915)-N(3))-methyltransferase RlmH [Terriglobia bacterium]|nr:23S rRNA (pseudouridine(1915)-N(3))-methyltransferase RlmH [Terriglobia bacterium]
MRIRLIAEGRTRNEHLRALQQDYEQRIAHFVELSVEPMPRPRGRGGAAWKLAAPAEQRLLEKLRGSYKVVLDEHGREWTSEELSRWLGQQALRGTRELAFLVGGADGFSAAFRKEADLLLAVSRMTLTHDWAHTLMLEQIYRAFTILRGYPYPR